MDKHKIDYSKTQLKKKAKEGYPCCKECNRNNIYLNKKELDKKDLNKKDINIKNIYDIHTMENHCINVPPKRLIMILENDCDFCEYDLSSQTHMKFIDFNLYPHMGWQFCEKCNYICEKNGEQFSIDIEILKKEFQDNKFKVIRTNGQIETGWYIAGNAIKYNISNDFKITICNKKDKKDMLTKCIDLKLLRSWQL